MTVMGTARADYTVQVLATPTRRVKKWQTTSHCFTSLATQTFGKLSVCFFFGF